MKKITLTIGQSVVSSSDNYYRIVSNLGSGGNSTVFMVLCTSGIMKGMLFSLKIFCNIERKERIAKFLDEIDFLEEVDHPAIIRVYDKGEFRVSSRTVYPFVVSEYYPLTLQDAIKSGVSLIDKTIYTINLLSGLYYLSTREKKIIHRDIKPQNIFIKGRNAILGDFGLMKILTEDESMGDADSDVEDIIVSAGAGMAFYYRTPDLVDYLNKKAKVTQASDIFQLGLVVAQMFTGVNPCKKCEKLTDPVELSSISVKSKKYGALIASNIRLMLNMDPNKRVSHELILDKWNGALETISKDVIEINGEI